MPVAQLRAPQEQKKRGALQDGLRLHESNVSSSDESKVHDDRKATIEGFACGERALQPVVNCFAERV